MAEELAGKCGACGKEGPLRIMTSPLNAPASVGLCPECYEAATLPLDFVRFRVEYAGDADIRDFASQSERYGFTVLVDGVREPLGPLLASRSPALFGDRETD